MGLEIATNKTPGTEVRRTPAPRPAMVGFMILVLTLIEFLLFGLVVNAVIQGWNSPSHVTTEVAAAPLGNILKSDQQIISAWLAGVFYCLAMIIFLYQRYFMDHITIVKRRFRKWEDEGVQLHG